MYTIKYIDDNETHTIVVGKGFVVFDGTKRFIDPEDELDYDIMRLIPIEDEECLFLICVELLRCLENNTEVQWMPKSITYSVRSNDRSISSDTKNYSLPYTGSELLNWDFMGMTWD